MESSQEGSKEARDSHQYNSALTHQFTRCGYSTNSVRPVLFPPGTPVSVALLLLICARGGMSQRSQSSLGWTTRSAIVLGQYPAGHQGYGGDEQGLRGAVQWHLQQPGPGDVGGEGLPVHMRCALNYLAMLTYLPAQLHPLYKGPLLLRPPSLFARTHIKDNESEQCCCCDPGRGMGDCIQIRLPHGPPQPTGLPSTGL